MNHPVNPEHLVHVAPRLYVTNAEPCCTTTTMLAPSAEIAIRLPVPPGASLPSNAHVFPPSSEIAACTGREPAPGALYTTLDRMEEKGIVRSWFGEATPQRGGRAKRYFALTKAGRAALVSAQEAYQSLLNGLNLFGGADA